MQHAVEQMRARVQSLDDRMARLGNDVAAQRAALEERVNTTREVGSDLSLGVTARAARPWRSSRPSCAPARRTA
jgi:hypothetical protein